MRVNGWLFRVAGRCCRKSRGGFLVGGRLRCLRSWCGPGGAAPRWRGGGADRPAGGPGRRTGPPADRCGTAPVGAWELPGGGPERGSSCTGCGPPALAEGLLCPGRALSERAPAWLPGLVSPPPTFGACRAVDRQARGAVLRNAGRTAPRGPAGACELSSSAAGRTTRCGRETRGRQFGCVCANVDQRTHAEIMQRRRRSSREQSVNSGCFRRWRYRRMPDSKR